MRDSGRSRRDLCDSHERSREIPSRGSEGQEEADGGHDPSGVSSIWSIRDRVRESARYPLTRAQSPPESISNPTHMHCAFASLRAKNARHLASAARIPDFHGFILHSTHASSERIIWSPRMSVCLLFFIYNVETRKEFRKGSDSPDKGFPWTCRFTCVQRWSFDKNRYSEISRGDYAPWKYFVAANEIEFLRFLPFSCYHARIST